MFRKIVKSLITITMVLLFSGVIPLKGESFGPIESIEVNAASNSIYEVRTKYIYGDYPSWINVSVVSGGKLYTGSLRAIRVTPFPGGQNKIIYGGTLYR